MLKIIQHRLPAVELRFRSMWGSRRVWSAVIYSLVRWGVFAVALAVLPVLLRVLDSVARGESLGFERLFSGGELLLVSAAVSGAALAELVTEGGLRLRTLKLTVGGSAGLLAITASAWYADITAGIRDGSNLDSHGIAVGSVVIFGFALFVGVCCILVAEWAKAK